MFGFIYILSSTCKVFFCKKNEGGGGSDNYVNWLGSSWVVVQKVIFRWNNILYQIFSTAFAVKRYFQLATFNWSSRSSVHPFPFHILFLSRSGHLGIGLVGDNHPYAIHPIPWLFVMSIEILFTLNENNYDGFSGVLRKISDVQSYPNPNPFYDLGRSQDALNRSNPFYSLVFKMCSEVQICFQVFTDGHRCALDVHWMLSG